jgi:muramoyltetrapeptide carboxypeptidase
MRKPRALTPGDRVAVVAPASPVVREELEAGMTELRKLGFEPTYEASVFERQGYVAGPAELRASAWLRAWTDPSIAALVAARGGYGSVQLLPWLAGAALQTGTAKAFIGYSDNTSIMAWLTTRLSTVTIHGPMIEHRLARGEAGYDRGTFLRCVCQAAPMGEVTHPQLETLIGGERRGVLVGGTLTQLLSSLGTPYAFDPPEGSLFFLDEVAERPYRLDRMLVQLKQSGLLRRAGGVVFGELPRCDEPGGPATARDVVREVLGDFPGPVLFGLPSGHTSGAALTLPLGVKARIVATSEPLLVVEEAAVE